MLTSDNGPHKEGGHNPEFFNSNGPLKGYKRDLYEGGIRTFLLARWPGKIEAGTTSELISAHWDMLPTFCELAGTEPPSGIDGVSIVPTLVGSAEAQPTHDYLYWEFYERGGRRAVRFGQWKAIQQNLNNDPNSPVELYHLPSDIGEETDVAAKHPDLVKQAKQYFQDAHTPSPFWAFGKPARGKKKSVKKPAA